MIDLYALLILYLCGVVVWFVYIAFCLEDTYEAAIVIAVFYPVIVAIIYLVLTFALITMPIMEIIEKIKRQRARKKNNDGTVR